MGPDPASTLATANFWLQISTFAVVLGVILEFFDLLFFSKEMSRVQKALMFFATALVVAGCGGEYFFEQQANGAEAALQRQSDEKIAALTRAEAADNKIATEAAAKAGALGVTVGTLDQAVKGITARASAIIDEAKPRLLTAAQKRSFAAAIPRATASRVDVESMPYDLDGAAFAEQLVQVMKSVGVHTDLGVWAYVRGPFVAPKGSSVAVEEYSSAGSAAGSAWVRALKAAGIRAAETPDGVLEANPRFLPPGVFPGGAGFLIVVGPKPLPKAQSAK